MPNAPLLSESNSVNSHFFQVLNKNTYVSLVRIRSYQSVQTDQERCNLYSVFMQMSWVWILGKSQGSCVQYTCRYTEQMKIANYMKYPLNLILNIQQCRKEHILLQGLQRDIFIVILTTSSSSISQFAGTRPTSSGLWSGTMATSGLPSIRSSSLNRQMLYLNSWKVKMSRLPLIASQLKRALTNADNICWNLPS